MNNMEYYSANHRNEYHKYIHKLLNEWKLANSITERCVVHHRDDTEECCKYNEEHYELWGFNLDGTFEYGKYIALHNLAFLILLFYNMSPAFLYRASLSTISSRFL